jgi:GntR family transcriptional regulator, rspAB operon transcriptional repressor
MTTLPSLKSDTNATYQQQAYDYVKGLVTGLKLKPGQTLTDSQIAAELKFSRTPVREALRRLEQEGLLVSDSRRGWKIYSLSLDDLRQIFELKQLLEGLIVEQAAACQDPALRSALQEALASMQNAASAGDYEAWRLADARLHQTIQHMSRNRRACTTVQSLDDQWFRLRAGYIALEGRMQRSAHEHAEIVSSLLAGHGVKAAEKMRAHIEYVYHDLIDTLRLVMPFVQGNI